MWWSGLILISLRHLLLIKLRISFFISSNFIIINWKKKNQGWFALFQAELDKLRPKLEARGAIFWELDAGAFWRWNISFKTEKNLEHSGDKKIYLKLTKFSAKRWCSKCPIIKLCETSKKNYFSMHFFSIKV